MTDWAEVRGCLGSRRSSSGTHDVNESPTEARGQLSHLDKDTNAQEWKTQFEQELRNASYGLHQRPTRDEQPCSMSGGKITRLLCA